MPSISSNLAYNRANFMTVVDVTAPTDSIFKPGEVDLCLDALDQNLVDFVESLTGDFPLVWKQGMRITTICYKIYGFTTAWWIVLLYNGLQTPFQLQPGMQLKMPLQAQMSRYVTAKLLPNTSGRLVTLP